MTKTEMEQGFQRIWDLFAETDRKFEESHVKFSQELEESHVKFSQELEASHAKFSRELQASRDEFDRRFAETDKLIKELRYLSERTDAKVEALSSKWGRFVEGLVIPAAERLFEERGFQIDGVSPRNRRRKGGDTIEIDVMAIGEQDVIAIEVKSSLSVDDVKEFLETLTKFKTFFPEYASQTVFGAVAGIVIEENADRYAYQRGLFVIGESGETVRILNDQKFRPKAW